MIKLDRDYSSQGKISAGSGLYVFDDIISKYVLLIPTSDMPSENAPESIENPLLTVSVNGQVEGKQSLEQMEFTFNWTRDNQRRLSKYAGKTLNLLIRDGMEYTGRLLKGTLAFGRDAQSDNDIMNGLLWVTPTEDMGNVDDIRDIIAQTSIITSALVTDVKLDSKSLSTTFSQTVQATTGATVTAKSESDTIATATLSDGQLTITPVAKGNTIIVVSCSGTSVNEGSSERTIMVTVA